jgi:hypothetical protein
MRPILVSSAFLALFAATAPAQSAVSPGWSAFSGCWAPQAAEGAVVPDSAPRVCVVPTGTNSADLVSVVSGKVTERTRIDADGQHHDVAKQGCSGWESAAFSSDGRRLYLTSEQQCLGGVKRVASGVFAIASNGDWINATNVAADSGNSVRVARYTAFPLVAAIPAEVRDALEPREVADRTARISALAPVTTNAVMEAGKFLSPPAIEAWLAELEQDFNLDEKTLIRLADGGVAPSVIDVMVAVSNPKVFAVRPTGTGFTLAESDSLAARRALRHNDCVSPVIDPWAWYAYDPCDPYDRYYRSRRFGYGYRYDPYYYGYGAYGYGYGGYGYGGYGGPVVIIVRGSPNDLERGHGKMTKDGYTRGTSTPRGTAGTTSTASRERAPRDPDAGTRTTSSGTSSGTTSTGSSSSSGSSSGGGSGRTATRKPPAA